MSMSILDDRREKYRSTNKRWAPQRLTFMILYLQTRAQIGLQTSLQSGSQTNGFAYSLGFAVGYSFDFAGFAA